MGGPGWILRLGAIALVIGCTGAPLPLPTFTGPPVRDASVGSQVSAPRCTVDSPDVCLAAALDALAGEGQTPDDHVARRHFEVACKSASEPHARARACGWLGRFSLEGRGWMDGRPTDAKAGALDALRSGCEADDRDLCAYLGGRDGELLARQRACELLDRRSCEALAVRKDPESLALSCRMGVPEGCRRASALPDSTQLRAALDEGCARGSSDGCTALALRTVGEKRRHLLERGCALGRGDACFVAAFALEEPGPRPVDTRPRAPADSNAAPSPEVQSLLKTGCRHGHARSCVELAHRTDGADARAYWQRACDQEHGAACLEVGLRWLDDDPTLATRSFRQGCALADARSCRNLGLRLQRGLGETRNDVGARLALEKACAAGLGDGCTDLGIIYEQGLGVRASRLAAAERFRDGCKAGSGNGCTYLGTMAISDGAVDDGMRWLRKGCGLGSDAGCQQLQRIRRALR